MFLDELLRTRPGRTRRTPLFVDPAEEEIAP
jgi:hypothetical protein